MTTRLVWILPRLVLTLALLVAPLPPVPAARAATGVLDQIQIYGQGIFKSVADAARWVASETARRMFITPSGFSGGDGLRFWHIGNVGPQGVVPEIVKMIVAQDGIATLTGRASPGSTIIVQSAGQTVGTARAAATGTWRLQLNYRLNEGDHNIQSLIRGADGRTVVRGPGIRVAVPEDFSGSTVVYQMPTLRPQKSRDSFDDVQDRVRIGQAPPSAPSPSTPPSDDQSSLPADDDSPVVVDWLYRWLNTSSTAYQDIVVPDLSGRDRAKFPLTLPALDGPAHRRFATDPDRGSDRDDEAYSDGWLVPGLSDWVWDGAGIAESRIRDWLADARRVFGSDVVRELSTGEPVSPADQDLSDEGEDARIAAAPEDGDDQGEPPADDKGAPPADVVPDTSSEDDMSTFPWPFADQPEPPQEPDVADTTANDVPDDDVAVPSFPWPLATEQDEPPATQPNAVTEEELERRKREEEAILKAQKDAEKAREEARAAAEKARKSREETERLLAEEERLAKEAEVARAERELARERAAKEAAEQLAKQKAEAAAEEEESERQAERLRRRAEELAAAATAAADEEFARGKFGEPKIDTDVAAGRPAWPVVQDKRRPSTPRRLSLKDSPSDIVEEGSTEGSDADEVYIPEAKDIAPVKKRAAKRTRSYRAKAAKRRVQSAKKRTRQARKATRRHRHARKARYSKPKRTWRKRKSHRRGLYRSRVFGFRAGRSAGRYCVDRRLRKVRRSLRRHLGRLVRGHRRLRRRGLYIDRVRWRRR